MAGFTCLQGLKLENGRGRRILLTFLTRSSMTHYSGTRFILPVLAVDSNNRITDTKKIEFGTRSEEPNRKAEEQVSATESKDNAVSS